MNHSRRSAALLLGIVLLAAACGDDNEDEAAAADPDSTEQAMDQAAGEGGDYCDLARAMDEGDGPPTDEQLAGLSEAAPEEIAEHVEYVADAVSDRGFQAFFDDDVQEHFGPVEEYEAEECGIAPLEEAELPEGVTTEIAPDVPQVAVSARDYGFVFDAPQAGPASFVMTNDGDEPHHMIVVALAEGVDLHDAVEADEADLDDMLLFDAESDVVMPGEEAVLTFENLEPGEYGIVCFVPDDEGTPHAFVGMAVQFTVRDS